MARPTRSWHHSPDFQQGSGSNLWVPMACTDSERSNEQRGVTSLRSSAVEANVPPPRLRANSKCNARFQLQIPTVTRLHASLHPARGTITVGCGTLALCLLAPSPACCYRVPQCGDLAARRAAQREARRSSVREASAPRRARRIGPMLGRESNLLSLAGGGLGHRHRTDCSPTLFHLIPRILQQAHFMPSRVRVASRSHQFDSRAFIRE